MFVLFLNGSKRRSLWFLDCWLDKWSNLRRSCRFGIARNQFIMKINSDIIDNENVALLARTLTNTFTQMYTQEHPVSFPRR